MVTADTITDEQIRQLRDSVSRERDTVSGDTWKRLTFLLVDCDIAIGYRAPAQASSVKFAKKQCAAAWNARYPTAASQ